MSPAPESLAARLFTLARTSRTRAEALLAMDDLLIEDRAPFWARVEALEARVDNLTETLESCEEPRV